MSNAAIKTSDLDELMEWGMKPPIQLSIESEISPLKTVLLHRPGQELENLTPDTLEELLFDDIPFLEIAQQEHDYFAAKLEELGTTVVYLENLMAEVLTDNSIREQFIEEFLSLANLNESNLKIAIIDYLNSLTPQIVTQKLISGIKKDELDYINKSFSAHINRDCLFAIAPLPNLYFTRDPASVFRNTVNFNNMYAFARHRETLFTKYIFTYHPQFKANHSYNWQTSQYSIEGGDIIVLTKDTLAIGVSQRTEAQAVEALAQNLFFNKDGQQIKKILVFHIPSSRAFMHLDTVLTQVDYDKFAIHPGIVEHTGIYELTANQHQRLQYRQLSGSIDTILSTTLDRKVTIFKCGGHDVVSSRREQWSDGANTLAVKPGEVLVYKRNKVTNQILQDSGIKVHAISCSELSRGRGGPRCMSMPLIRKS